MTTIRIIGKSGHAGRMKIHSRSIPSRFVATHYLPTGTSSFGVTGTFRTVTTSYLQSQQQQQQRQWNHGRLPPPKSSPHLATTILPAAASVAYMTVESDRTNGTIHEASNFHLFTSFSSSSLSQRTLCEATSAEETLPTSPELESSNKSQEQMDGSDAVERSSSSNSSSGGGSGKGGWGAVKEEDVDALVDLLMKDPAVNIALLPDSLESQLYKMTILLTINAIYYWLYRGLNGRKFLSHELQLKQIIAVSEDQEQEESLPPPSWLVQAITAQKEQPVNDAVLRTVAQRLVSHSPMVNVYCISDEMEVQIYTACLQVIFRVLQALLATIQLHFCGHVIQLSLLFPKQEGDESGSSGGNHPMILSALENALKQDTETTKIPHSSRVSRMTPVDVELLREWAQTCGNEVRRHSPNHPNHPKESSPPTWWNQILNAVLPHWMKKDNDDDSGNNNSQLMEEIQVSLLSFLLGLLDDLLLGQLKMQLLSDMLVLDLVPASVSSSSKSALSSTPTTDSTMVSTNSSSSSSAAAVPTNSKDRTSSPVGTTVAVTSSFVAGMGTGAILVLAAMSMAATK